MKYLAFLVGVLTVVVGYLAFTQVTVNGNGEVEVLGSSMTGSVWFLNASQQIQAAATGWGLRVPFLANCDSIDTNASGVFSCGTDATGGGGGGGGSISTSTTPVAGQLAFWTSSSALSSVATGTLTESVSGLQFDQTRGLVGGSAALSLSAGFAIPSTTDYTGWNLASSSRHSAVTLSGVLDYITLVGQDIVRGAIDLATDITGTLLVGNGGTGLTSTSTFLFENEIDTESELEAFLTDVTNVFTNNDGALADDNLTNNSIEDLNDVGAMTENTGDLLTWNGSAWTDTATSALGYSWNNLINIPAGFADGTDDTGGGGGGGGLATTSPWTNGDLAFVTGLGTVGSVATGTLTTTATGTQFSATRGVVGGSSVFSWATGYDAVLFASTTQWASFYNTPSGRITAGTGIDWSGNTLNGVYTAGDALTLTGEDFDFDGGATPQGELGGTWASPTIDDSLAVTGWNLTSPTLTSFFGTPCTSGEFLTDISDTGVFTCTAGGGGGGGGALSTTTDVIGSPATPELVSYVTGDVMFGGSASTSAEFQFDDDGGQFIISSSSANATATIESNNNAQAVRIGDDIGSGLEYVFSTVGDAIMEAYGAVTRLVVAIAETLFQGNVKVTGTMHVATTTYYGATTTDALVIDGYTNSGEWIQEFCTTPTAESVRVAADTLRGCGRYNYAEDGAGSINFVLPITGTSTYFNLQPGATGDSNASGDGIGINWADGLDFGDIQRHLPAMEFAIRQSQMANATGTFIQAGLTSALGMSADFASEPAQGFYVFASSTQANYLLACNPSTGATTYVDTGIASSTVTTVDANPFVHFRLEVGGTANTAVTAILKARTTTDRNMTKVGSCTLNVSSATTGVAPVVGIGKSGAGTSSDLHLMFLKFWYKQPVF